MGRAWLAHVRFSRLRKGMGAERRPFRRALHGPCLLITGKLCGSFPVPQHIAGMRDTATHMPGPPGRPPAPRGENVLSGRAPRTAQSRSVLRRCARGVPCAVAGARGCGWPDAVPGRVTWRMQPQAWHARGSPVTRLQGAVCAGNTGDAGQEVESAMPRRHSRVHGDARGSRAAPRRAGVGALGGEGEAGPWATGKTR